MTLNKNKMMHALNHSKKVRQLVTPINTILCFRYTVPIYRFRHILVCLKTDIIIFRLVEIADIILYLHYGFRHIGAPSTTLND